ncbi:cysteine desulfurase family protein [Calditrichota bacterium GD2]
MKRIYLDNAATTPMVSEVIEAMHEWNTRFFGNPSSVHHFGQIARARLEECRDIIADFLGVPSKKLFFTSGGTEGNNWILKSVAAQLTSEKKHILISALEHASVFETARFLKKQGADIDFIEPDGEGLITVDQIQKVLRKDTAFISIMYVNNETGIINPVKEIADFCKKNNIQFHCDAVQALGKVDFELQEMDVDFLTVSAHKIHGPKAVGAVYIKEPALLEPFLHGGQQEAGTRAGTENVSGIIGFARAAQWIASRRSQRDKVKQLQRYFEERLKELFEKAVVIGDDAPRTPFISQVAFPGVDNQNLLMRLDLNGIAVSVGSACSSGTLKPSRVLQKMNLTDDVVRSALRFSFSYLNTLEEIETTLENLKMLIS